MQESLLFSKPVSLFEASEVLLNWGEFEYKLFSAYQIGFSDKWASRRYEFRTAYEKSFQKLDML